MSQTSKLSLQKSVSAFDKKSYANEMLEGLNLHKNFAKSGEIRENFPYLDDSLISKIFIKFLQNYLFKSHLLPFITRDKHKPGVTLLYKRPKWVIRLK